MSHLQKKTTMYIFTKINFLFTIDESSVVNFFEEILVAVF